MIYALVICMYASDPYWAKANGCSFPENGMTYFRTLEECKRVVDNANQSYESNTREDTKFKRTLKCVSKSSDPWTLE